MVRLGHLALAAAAADPRAGDGYTPDAALVNYGHDARLGTHQDKDERDDAPVVSLPIGDSCTFRLGNTRGRGRPYQDVPPASGDLFVSGGPARSAYHAVTKVHPRLVGSTGMFTGYAGGLDRKRGLLRIEQETALGLGRRPRAGCSNATQPAGQRRPCPAAFGERFSPGKIRSPSRRPP